jgi:hypothetical protein
VKAKGTIEAFMAVPAERLKEYHFWGVLNRYVSGFEEIVVNELGCIGGGDTREEVVHDVTFKLWDEISRLHDMGEHVTVRSREAAKNFAKQLCDELRGDAESEVERWSLVRITVDMENQPPGLPQEQLDAIAAFARESWEEYLAETAAAQLKCACQ